MSATLLRRALRVPHVDRAASATPMAFQFDAVDASPYVERGETLTVVENDGSFAVAGGNGVFTAQSSPDHNDLGIKAASISRAAGFALVVKFSAITSSEFWATGFHASDALGFGPSDVGALIIGRPIASGGVRLLLDNDKITFDVADYNSADSDLLAVVLRAAGAFYLFNQQLMWVDDNYSGATLYPMFANYSSDLSLSAFVPCDLSGEVSFESLLTTEEIAGSVSAGTTFMHDADGWIEWTQTVLPTSPNATRMLVRHVDDDNCWQINVQGVGASSKELVLYERVSGSPTQRASSAGGAVVAGDRIKVKCVGTTITAYINGEEAWSYASASNFATESDGKRNDSIGTEDGTASDLITRPYNIPSAVQTAIEGVIE